MDDNAALRIALRKKFAKSVAALVRQMLSRQKRIAECEPWRNAVFVHKGKNLLRPIFAKSHTSAAPQTVRRCAVYRPDIAPVVKILPMLTENGQKCGVKLVEFKQPRQMIICFCCRKAHLGSVDLSAFIIISHTLPQSQTEIPDKFTPLQKIIASRRYHNSSSLTLRPPCPALSLSRLRATKCVAQRTANPELKACFLGRSVVLLSWEVF